MQLTEGSFTAEEVIYSTSLNDDGPSRTRRDGIGSDQGSVAMSLNQFCKIMHYYAKCGEVAGSRIYYLNSDNE